MHEISVCQSIIDTVAAETKEQLQQVREIHLEVGILSCVQPSILENIYAHLVLNGPLQNSSLRVKQVDVKAKCKVCHHRFMVEDYLFVCPNCGSPAADVTEGKEMKIVKIVLEEQKHEKVNE